MEIKKHLKSENLLGLGSIILLILVIGFYYGWFLPAKPSVVLKMDINETEIYGFAYAKSSLPMQCGSCVGYSGVVDVYFENKLICHGEGSTINLGTILLPILCENNDLSNYVGKNVTIKAIGKITPAWDKTQILTEQKTLNVSFLNKK